jgi:hypothetical protein
MAAADFPDSRTIPSAPWPGGVAMAAIVSSSIKPKSVLQKLENFMVTIAVFFRYLYT